MKKIKNLLDIIAITVKIYWTKFQIIIIKQLIKLQNEMEAFQLKTN